MTVKSWDFKMAIETQNEWYLEDSVFIEQDINKMTKCLSKTYYSMGVTKGFRVRKGMKKKSQRCAIVQHGVNILRAHFLDW
jgi:hypothetical protein